MLVYLLHRDHDRDNRNRSKFLTNCRSAWLWHKWRMEKGYKKKEKKGGGTKRLLSHAKMDKGLRLFKVSRGSKM